MRVFCRKDPYSQIYATEKRKCNVTNLPWGSGATFSWYRWIQLKQIVKKWIIRTIYNSEVSLRKTQMHQNNAAIQHFKSASASRIVNRWVLTKNKSEFKDMHVLRVYIFLELFTSYKNKKD